MRGVRLPYVAVLFVDLHYHGNAHVKFWERLTEESLRLI